MRTALVFLTAGVSAILPTACSTGRSVAETITVNADDGGCALARDVVVTGSVTFEVVNRGQKVTEFYVYAPGNRVLAEVEDIAPGQSRPLDVALEGPGDYEVSCRPGMTGNDIRRGFHARTPS